MNIALFNFIFYSSSNSIIGKIALFLSYPFAYGVIFILIIWAIFLSKNKMFNFSLLFLSGLSSWVMAFVLKGILQVNRPFVDLNIIPLYKETGYSFPSEHMAVFTAIAVSMFLIDKRAGLVFSVIAILIGLSRIAIGVHYPLDIVGGLAVGLITSLIFIEIFKKV